MISFFYRPDDPDALKKWRPILGAAIAAKGRESKGEFVFAKQEGIFVQRGEKKIPVPKDYVFRLQSGDRIVIESQRK